MYDYVMIYSDAHYEATIPAREISQFLVDTLAFQKTSHLKFHKEIAGEIIRITGIQANSSGGYAFDSLEGVEEINLLEIDLPNHLSQELEDHVRATANRIASQFSWIIDLRE